MRFLAMVGIVMEHSSPFLGLKISGFYNEIIQTVALQFIKFGTIVFFILAGFLIGDKFHQYTTKEYLKRRVHSTLRPWFFWFSIFLALIYINQGIICFKNGDPRGFYSPVTYFFHQLFYIITETSFWFIINFIFCIAVLLFFRKYMYKIWLGVFFGLLSLFYAVNLYFEWIPTGHTTALFGFIFYLWLGVILHKYFESFKSWINRRTFFSLFSLVIITYVLSCAETLLLMRAGSFDSLNTLRITNIIFSFASFLFLYRFCNFKAIEKLNPRSMTFGIHLVHHILIIIFLPMLLMPLGIVYSKEPIWNLFWLQFIIFLLIYSATFVVVNFIRKSDKWKWTVGQ